MKFHWTWKVCKQCLAELNKMGEQLTRLEAERNVLAAERNALVDALDYELENQGAISPMHYRHTEMVVAARKK